jgi:hypothetical protein
MIKYENRVLLDNVRGSTISIVKTELETGYNIRTINGFPIKSNDVISILKDGIIMFI